MPARSSSRIGDHNFSFLSIGGKSHNSTALPTDQQNKTDRGDERDKSVLSSISSKLKPSVSSGPSKTASAVASGQISVTLLSIARELEKSYEIDIEAEIELLDPSEMTDEDIVHWTDIIAKSNKTKDTETWMLERFWLRTRYLVTPTRARSHSQQMQRHPDDARSSFEEYEEIVKGSNQRCFATFKTMDAAFQETIGSVPGKNRISTTTMSTGVSASGVRGIGWDGRSASMKTMTSRRTTQTTQTSKLSVDSERDHKLEDEQKLDIAIVQIRRMKDEMAAKKEQHEINCQNILAVIEGHKEHQKSVRKYRLRFNQERKRGNGVIKFYDDVIKQENHAIDIIRLSNRNLKRRLKAVMQTMLQMREEGKGGYKLVDYQELELFNNRSQEVLASQASVMTTLKKTLGDCNFYCNRWRRHLEAAESESAKLTRESNLRNSIKGQLESEAKTVRATKEEVLKETNQLQALERDFVKPEVISYVEEVASNRSLEREVHAWERRVKLQQFTLSELTNTLRSMQSQHRLNTTTHF